MKLVAPTNRYEQDWLQALTEFKAEGTTGFWDLPEKPTSIDEYVLRTTKQSQGLNLPDDWVSATTFWLIDNGNFIGHVNIRHKLNEHLSKIGGHIGYAIRPTCRKRGYGSKILELAIPKARELGISKALITCYDDNIGSARIIEKNGGELQQKITVDGKIVRHYILKILPK